MQNILNQIKSYSKYPKYKESGIEWLGEIPEGWEVIKYGYLFKSAMGETILKENLIDEGKIPVYSATEENLNFGYVDSANVILNSGDLVIPARGNSIGNVKLVDKISTTTQTTIYSKPISHNKFDIRFIVYLLNGLKDIYFFFDRTAIPQITVNQVRNNLIVLPILEEQQSIADFLDRETGRIDRLIEKKQKLVELLYEKRTALISNAVTKGIGPNAKMKDSGVEWLGEIPEGWEVKRLKYATSFKYGESLTEEDRDNEGNIDIYGSNGIVGTHNKSVTNGETIIIGRKGSYGQINWSQKSCFPIDTTFFIDKSTTDNNLRWIYYLLQTLKLDESNQDSAVPGLNREIAYNWFIPLPNNSDQQLITNFLDRRTAKTDNLIQKIQSQISKLKEYRTALISEAVTGKIKIN